MTFDQQPKPRQQPRHWAALVPVRNFGTAKSRLRQGFSDDMVETIARSLAQHVLVALESSLLVRRVVVVSDAHLSGEPGFEHVEHVLQHLDSQDDHLNAGIEQGVRYLRQRDQLVSILVLPADLAFVDAAEIDEVLRRAGSHDTDCFVTDHQDVGTSALMLQPGSTRRSAFGLDSAQRHRELGFSEIELSADSGMRFDVDTPEDARSFLARQPILQAVAAPQEPDRRLLYP